MQRILLLAALLFSSNRLLAQNDQPVYVDSLQTGWQDYGWAAPPPSAL